MVMEYQLDRETLLIGTQKVRYRVLGLHLLLYLFLNITTHLRLLQDGLTRHVSGDYRS